MKKIKLFITALLLSAGLLTFNNAAACTGGTLQGSLVPTSAWQTMSGIQGGEYWTFAGVAGRVYQFSFCQGGGSYVDDPQIQILNNSGVAIVGAYNDDHCGLGSELIWVCPSGGTYRVAFYEYNCQTSGTALGTVAYQYLPTPTRADCLGARPLCQANNTVDNLESTGSGHYYDLYNYLNNGLTVNDNNCPDCIIQGENYSNWYSFYATQTGSLNFTITPSVASQDFDWAVWDMTGRECSDLATGSAWGTSRPIANTYPDPISCNYCGIGGTTGAGGGSAGCTQHDPSCNRFNSSLSVTAGRHYMLFIDNFSATTNGYSINFSGASVFDQTAPVLSSIVYPPVCGSSSVTVQFSEAVSCTSMQNSCMTVTGPNGSLTVDNIWSSTCVGATGNTYSSGTFYDDIWTIDLGDYIMDAGNYTVSLTNGCATDVCGNGMPSSSTSTLPFSITALSATMNITHTCAGYSNGALSVTGVSGGTSPYYYTWSTGATTSSISGLPGGSYSVTVTDAIGRCEWTESAVVQSIAAPSNDNCANATVISSFPYSSGSLYNYCSTNDVPASQTAGCGIHYNNVWYRVTGTGDQLTASTCSAASFDTEIHVYTGACGSMTEVVCNDDGSGCGLQSSVSWCTTAGTTYYISVGAYGSTGFGTYTLSVTAAPYATPVAGSNTPVCNGSTLNLTGSGVAGSTFSWTGPSSYTSADQNPSLSPANGTMTGNYIVTITSPTGCTTSANTDVTIDVTNPSYVGYSNISGYQYQESATVYWVKGGNNFSIDITHSDNISAKTQYFGFNKDDCNPNSCGGAPYEIKSYNSNNVFTDWMADNTYIDITSANCVDGDGVCTDNDVTRRWVSNIKTTCADWDYKLHTYLYDHCNFGVGYTDMGLWVKVDNTAPTHDNVTVSDNCWIANGTNTYTITIVSTEPRSGFGGSYGMMALVNYNLGEPNAGGYFAWHPTSYVHTDNQMACTGGGYVSKASTWGGSRIDLVSAVTSVSGNQRTVTFTVRPHTDFIELNGTNKISMYTSDKCNNYRGWTLFNTNFTVMKVPATPVTATTICNGSSANLSTASTPATGITYYWQTSSIGTSTSIGSGTSITVSPSSTTTYYVRPYSSSGCWGQASAGVTVSVTPNPSNDNCANAVVIGSLPYSSGILNNNCATNDVPVNQDGGCDDHYNNVWFRVTGTGNSITASLVNGSTDFDTEIHVYTGSCGAQTEVACNDDYSGLQSQTSWCSVSGTTYYISVGGYDDYFGNYVLSVTDNPLSAPTSVSASPATICTGSSSTLTGTIGTNGNNISWYTGSCGGTLAGTGTSLSVSPGSTTTYYARTTGSCGNVSAACTSVTVTVNTLSTAPTSISGTTTICSGNSTTLTATGGSGGTGASYQWYAGGCGSGSVLGIGASLTVSPSSNTTYYVRRTGTCNTTTCASTTVTVNSLSTAPTSITGTTSICTGGSTTLTASGGTAGTNSNLNWYTGSCGTAYIQEWFSQPYSTGSTSLNSVNGILDVSSTTNDPMIFMSGLGSFDPSVYRYIQVRYRVVSGTAGNTEIFFYNASHGFAVGGESAAGALVSDGTWRILNIDMWSDPDYLTGGNITGWRYDWCTASGVRMEIDYIALGSSIAVGQGSSVTVSPSSTTTYYVNRSGTCNSTSCASNTVSVVADPAITTQPVGGTICTGGSRTLSVVATGGTPSLTYQWYNSGGAISGATSSSYTATAASNYYCIVSASGSGCGSVTSNTVTVSVVADPAITTQPVGGTICTGGSRTLSVVATGGTPSLTYQWYNSGGAISGATSSSYTATAASNYYCIVSASGSGCGSVTSSTVTVSVVADPAITTQPVGGTICAGGSLNLSVVATGGTPSLTYQWYNSGGAISGATSSSYTATAASNYYCIVSASGSGCGSVTSSTVTVSVVADPAITTQPVGGTICTGGSLNLSVVATGGTPSLTYQWYNSGGAISGATSSSYTATAASNYYCIVSASGNGCGSVTSSTVTVSVVADPTIATQPVGGTICAGGSLNLSVVATGGTPSLSYQWYNSGGAISGATSSSYTATAANNYYCIVSASGNGCGSVTSSTVTVSVVSDPAITTQPVGGTICAGGSLNLSVVATGGTPSLTYQWYNSGGAISGATSSSYTATAASNYYCIVSASGNGCGSVTSSTVTVSVVADPAITTQPVGGTICTGGSLNLSVVATGGTPSLTYQWYNSGGAISGATSSSYTATAASNYYCIVSASGNGCGSVTSSTVTVSVVADPAITTQPVGGTICTGGPLNLSVVATGGTPSLTYQWYNSGGAISGATSSSYTATAASNYYCIVSASGNGCGSVTSNTVTVSVVADPAIATQPVGGTICTGGSLNLSIAATGGTPSLTYQWYNSGGAISGATSSSYTATAANNYYCIVSASGNGCGSVTSSTVTVSVVADPAISTQPVGGTICTGGSLNLSVVATGGTPSLTYQWYNSGGAISGATSSSYTATAASNYYCIVSASGNGCGSVTSNTVTVSVVADPAITTQPVGGTICTGGSLNLYVVATGGTPSLTYQWYNSGGAISGATSSSYTATAASNYYCIVSASGSGCGSVTSSTVTVSVVADPAITTQPVGGTICTGGSLNLSVVATGGTPSLTYQWYNSGGAISGATSSSYTATAASNYYCIVSASGNGCGSVTSNTATISVNNPPTAPTSITGTSTVCAGGTTTLTATGGSEGSGCSYQWGTGSVIGSNIIAGAVSSSYTTPALAANTTYWVRRTGSSPCSNTTTGVTLLINVNAMLPVSVSISASDNPICYGLTNTFTATPVNGGTPTYQWKLNGINVGSNSATYTNSSLVTGNTISCVLTSSEACASGSPATSNTITMTVNTPPVTSLSTGDYVWAGNVSNAWENPSNWLVYSGSGFTTASAIPDLSKNVFLRDYSPCASNIATTSVSSAVSCKNITIETGLNLGANSELLVYGNWTNSGVFNAGTGKVNFNGTNNQTILSGGNSFYDIVFNNSGSGNSNIILTDNLTITNNATFTNGIVSPGSNKIIFNSGATSTPGNSDSFVDGLIERTGTGSFVVPSGNVNVRDIGAGNVTYRIWAPITINPVASTTTSVRYFFDNSGMPYWWNTGSNLDASIHHVTDREFWMVNSSENFANVTLFWKDNSHGAGQVCNHSLCDGTVSNYTASDLTVAYWSGTLWRDAGGSAAGNHDNGSISSSLQIPFGAKSQTFITLATKENLNPLPVELLYFTAKCDNSTSLLSWQTASETNNDFYIIEKSKDMVDFFEIGRVDGAGSSNQVLNYNYTDKELFSGDNYYRLKQVDFDGRITTYDAVTVNCDRDTESAPTMIAYPNPFKDELNVIIENLQDKNFVLEIYDDLGRVVFSQDFTSENSKFYTTLSLKDLRPAVYNLRSKSEGSVINLKIVKK